MAEADAVRNELEEDDELCDTDAVVRSIMQRRSDGEFPEVLPVESCSAAEGSTPAGRCGEDARGCRMPRQ